MPKVNSFAPELIEFFRQASVQTIRVPMQTVAVATALRSRLHKLRVAMRKENHHDLPLAEGVQVRIITDKAEEDCDVTLVGEPADNNYLKSLREAGIVIVTPKFTNIKEGEAVPQPQAESPSSAEGALARMVSNTKPPTSTE